ncbi:MAG: hypothetical protein JRG91_10210 [Deltaproteobacteria bacterium]|nr:hypothetical protein [Deltaproteobacteria bacterium]
MMHRCVLILSLAAFLAAPAHAQTIREDVKEHVEEGLEDSKKKKKKKKKKKYKKGTSPSGSGSGTSTGGSTEEGGYVIVLGMGQQDGPKLPQRVIGKNLQLDLKAGAGYRGWLPQQYPLVNVNMTHYFTWSVSLKARLFKWLNIRKGYFESNNAASPRASSTADGAKWGSYATKAAWVLAEIGFPITKMLEPSIRYEARSFQTMAKPKSGHEVCIIPFNMDADTEGCLPTSDPLKVVSSFETLVAGLRYIPGKNPNAVIHAPKSKIPRFFFGGGYVQYIKPYQVTIASDTLDKYLFTGRFRGGGLAFGATVGGGMNNIYFDFWMQLGLGETRLTKDMTLNELAPQDWLLGYVQGYAKLEYRWALWKFPPTLAIIPSATVGGASFFFFETNVKEDEETATPQVNWDFLYTVRVSVVLTL